MQAVFERFLERLSESIDEADLRGALADVASELDLLAFAYLSLPMRSDGKPTLISNYPAHWTSRYLENRYQSGDPVIVRARCDGCPFRWGSDLSGEEASGAQVFEEAAQFGICCGEAVRSVGAKEEELAARLFAVEVAERPGGAWQADLKETQGTRLERGRYAARSESRKTELRSYGHAPAAFPFPDSFSGHPCRLRGERVACRCGFPAM
ncbi:autoinducer binding domain-containing protein, partial [Mesorhizobium silamurunense]|uniref:autoinducer binding domain-containing protein n=1 Tax=Mesorhizobium silamurunense TaxID=499528 RepID=UPI0031BA6E8F